MNTSKVDKLYKIAMVQDGIESERDLIHAFAKLIVEECLDILDDEDDGDLEGRSVRIAAIRIKKLFGVEND